MGFCLLQQKFLFLHALYPTKIGKSGFVVSPDGLWGFKLPLQTEKFQYKINNIMCMGISLSMCTMCMPGIHRGNKTKNKNKKGVRSPRNVVTYNWEPLSDAGSQTQVLCKSSQCFNQRAISPAWWATLYMFIFCLQSFTVHLLIFCCWVVYITKFLKL